MDDILTFLLASDNLPFIISGSILLAILILEVIGLLVGLSMFHHDVDFEADLNGNGIPDYLEAEAGLMGWFNPGHVPLMVFLVLFSTIFTVIGYGAQWVYSGLTGSLAPMLLSVPLVTAATLPFVRWGTMAFARIMPRDITNAVTLESLSGLSGPLVVGPASKDVAGQVRITDDYGTHHYLFVFSDGDENIAIGENVVLLGPHREKSYAYVVRKI